MIAFSSLKHALVGNAAHTLMAFLAVVTISRVYGIAELGLYAYSLAAINTILFFYGLGLKNVIAADVNILNSWIDYSLFRLIGLCVAAFTASIIVVFMEFDWLFFTALFGAKTADHFSEVQQGVLLRHERHDLNKIMLFVRGGAFFFPLLLLSLSDCSFRVTVLAACAVSFMSFIAETSIFYRFLNKKYHREVRISISSRNGVNIARTALPLGVSSFVTSFTANFPRLFAGAFGGEVVAGVVAGLMQLAMMGVLFVNSLSQTLIPRVSQFWLSGDLQAIRKTYVCGSLIVLAGIVIILGVLALWGDNIITMILGHQFSGYQDMFLFVMLASALAYLAAINYATLTGIGSFEELQYIALMTMVCTLLFTPALFYVFGVGGIFGGFFLAQFFRFAFSYRVFTRRVAVT